MTATAAQISKPMADAIRRSLGVGSGVALTAELLAKVTTLVAGGNSGITDAAVRRINGKKSK